MPVTERTVSLKTVEDAVIVDLIAFNSALILLKRLKMCIMIFEVNCLV